VCCPGADWRGSSLQRALLRAGGTAVSAVARVAVLLSVAVAAFVLALSLGRWQSGRAAEKLAIEAQWERAEQAAPRVIDRASLPAADQRCGSVCAGRSITRAASGSTTGSSMVGPASG
jgi:hypothetical protein